MLVKKVTIEREIDQYGNILDVYEIVVDGEKGESIRGDVSAGPSVWFIQWRNSAASVLP